MNQIEDPCLFCSSIFQRKNSLRVVYPSLSSVKNHRLQVSMFGVYLLCSSIDSSLELLEPRHDPLVSSRPVLLGVEELSQSTDVFLVAVLEDLKDGMRQVRDRDLVWRLFLDRDDQNIDLAGRVASCPTKEIFVEG